MQTEARRLLITGLVQGVGFRYHMTATAQRLGVTGWVRNRSDGAVEAQVVGTNEQVAAMIHWASSGPPAARVAQVHVEALETVPEFSGFSQRETECNRIAT